MSDTIMQKKKVLKREDGSTIVVHRMNWHATKVFTKALGKTAQSVMGDLLASISTMLQKIDETHDFKAGIENLKPWLEKLPTIIGDSEDLLDMLIIESTGMKQEDVDKLDALEASEVIRAAFEVNFDRELKNCWSVVLSVVGDLFGYAKKTPRDKSTPSLPAADTPPTT